jgi:hypothetical protein
LTIILPSPFCFFEFKYHIALQLLKLKWSLLGDNQHPNIIF